MRVGGCRPRKHGQLADLYFSDAHGAARVGSGCAGGERHRHEVLAKNVIPLPTALPDFTKVHPPESEFERGDQVLALYPNTTCFYPGTVVQSPGKVRTPVRAWPHTTRAPHTDAAHPVVACWLRGRDRGAPLAQGRTRVSRGL